MIATTIAFAFTGTPSTTSFSPVPVRLATRSDP